MSNEAGIRWQCNACGMETDSPAGHAFLCGMRQGNTRLHHTPGYLCEDCDHQATALTRANALLRRAKHNIGHHYVFACPHCLPESDELKAEIDAYLASEAPQQ